MGILSTPPPVDINALDRLPISNFSSALVDIGLTDPPKSGNAGIPGIPGDDRPEEGLGKGRKILSYLTFFPMLVWFPSFKLFYSWKF